MLLLCSPQFIIEHPAFKDALIRAYVRRLLQMVTLDETHLYAQHGRSFRTSIRILQRVFFAIIFAAGVDYTPLLLAMTATMPQTLLQSLSDLTHIDFTNKRHQLWSTPNDFKQRYI